MNKVSVILEFGELLYMDTAYECETSSWHEPGIEQESSRSRSSDRCGAAIWIRDGVGARAMDQISVVIV